MLVAVDTGPLVALLDARDQYHEWARSSFAELTPPLVTCDAVLAEACHLVRRLRGGPDAVLGLCKSGAVQAAFHSAPETEALQTLMFRFSSVPMSFADACLVRMTELDAKLTVMTLDSDFRIYRKHGRRVVPLIMPPAP